MKKITYGILAHVDSGKTTFAEQILYHTKVIRKKGRVDHKDSYMDFNAIEKERGITVFSEQAYYMYNGNQYFFIDTPGHVDFQSEMERTAGILDYAVLLISGTEGVQSHTETLFRVLKEYNIPVFIFINKEDRDGFNKESAVKEIKEKLSEDIIDLSNYTGIPDETMIETAAGKDEELLKKYVEDKVKPEDWEQSAAALIKKRELIPLLTGSALMDQGIDRFLWIFDRLTKSDYEQRQQDTLEAYIYKIRYDEKNTRLSCLKILKGTIKVKEEILPYHEKINQIRLYNGEKFVTVSTAQAGDLVSLTGLNKSGVGENIGDCRKNRPFYLYPVLKAGIIQKENMDKTKLLHAFHILEEEDPMLNCTWEETLKQLQIAVMGTVQMEILKQLVKERFCMEIEFETPEVVYKETIKNTVVGYGHFEPLRHYAEVELELSQGERGSGITFESKCPVDILASNYQNLIRTHVLEKEHKGILTGSALTDVKVTLLSGISHIKHTEGGDFREAVYRAVRQGLEKAEPVLLEPFYRFKIEVVPSVSGRVFSDITKRNGSFDSPAAFEGKTVITGRGPVAAFLDYPKEFMSFSKGKGTLSFLPDGYDTCKNSDEVVAKKNYEKDRDLENTSSSVFCTKGAAFIVPWNEVEKYAHCLKK